MNEPRENRLLISFCLFVLSCVLSCFVYAGIMLDGLWWQKLIGMMMALPCCTYFTHVIIDSCRDWIDSAID